MAFYEAVFIARQDLALEDVDNLFDKLSKIITDAKGTIVSREYWGLRNLAYKIKKNSRGHYVLLSISSDYKAVEELKRVTSFNEDIIRSAVFVSDVKLTDKSQLFICSNAKEYKPGKVSEVDVSKYDSIQDQLQFDNVI